MSGTRRTISQRKLRAILLMAAAGGLSLAIPHHASATTDSWIGTSGGNWTDGTQWSAGVAPTAGQDVWITNAFSGSQAITFDSGLGLKYNFLAVDATGGGTNSISMAANNLDVNGDEYIGLNGVGNFNQSDGFNSLANLVLGKTSGANGTYTIGASATINASGDEYIGSTGLGFFNQSGDSSNVTGFRLVLGGSQGGSGVYNLSSGRITCDFGVWIGAQGLGFFNQSGGVLTDTGPNSIIVGYESGTGTYTLSAGEIVDYGSEAVGDYGSGTFNQTGGTNTIFPSTSITGGNFFIGYNFHSSGTYSQSGGSLSVGNNLIINQGSYALSGGSTTISGNASVGGNGKFGMIVVNGTGQLNVAGQLNIGNSSTVTLSGGSSSATAGALQIATGGNLVMNGPHNAFILNYGTAASPNASIRQYLQNGYNTGNWDAGGTSPNPNVGAITSSTATSSNAFSLGYADGSDGVVAGLSGGQEEIKFTYSGDANLDGQVNLTDLVMLANHFGSTGTNWDQGDFSYDGSVNLTDLTILASHFGDGIGNPLQDAQIHAQFAQDLATIEATDPAFATEVSRLVPEPSSISLLTLAGIGLLKRRSRSAAKKKE